MKVLVSLMALSLVLALAVPAVAEDAAALYKSKCQVCHGPDGKGSAAGQKLGAKAFSESKASDKELFEITKNGKGKMPKFDGKLTDEQINELVKYIKTLK
jgi:mono/diheme cytochrome c family protein